MAGEILNMRGNDAFVGSKLCIREAIAQNSTLLGVKCLVSLSDCIRNAVHHRKVSLALLHILAERVYLLTSKVSIVH